MQWFVLNFCETQPGMTVNEHSKQKDDDVMEPARKDSFRQLQLPPKLFSIIHPFSLRLLIDHFIGFMDPIDWALALIILIRYAY